VSIKLQFLSVCNAVHCIAEFVKATLIYCSSVGVVTDYRLDGPGSNPGGDEIFHPSRPALGPTQPPV